MPRKKKQDVAPQPVIETPVETPVETLVEEPVETLVETQEEESVETKVEVPAEPEYRIMALGASSIRELLEKANSFGIKKDEIIQILDSEGSFVMLYGR